MTKEVAKTDRKHDDAPHAWAPPSTDQEFVFKDIDSLPAWADKGWASYDRGPALAVPSGDIYGKAPYTTTIARIGDKVMFVAATASKAAHFEVIRGEPAIEDATILPAAQTNASLEDMVRGGTLAPGDLGPEAKAQLLQTNPELRHMIETGEGAPKKNKLAVKTA